MTLIANYRAVRHDDRDALLLAQRWSKYMAVTFAVGAVTGTVLSFEFGLLWPRFMGRWGAAFGVPFAFEGLFFFTEAIFVAIYIFGWRRLRPWTHFWTGVPIAIAGVFGAISVVAANAWMNAPAGFTLDSNGKVVDVDPWAVIFNKAMPLRGGPHGRGGLPGRRVPDRLGLRRRDAAGPDRPLPPPGFRHPVHRRRDRDPAPDGGRRHAGPLGVQQPAGEVRRHRAGAADRKPTSPRRCSATSTPNDTVSGGIPIPGMASWLSDPGDRHARRSSKGLDSVPGRPSDPPIAEVNVVHLAWDVMVGTGRCCSSSRSGTPPTGCSGAGCRPRRVVPARRGRCGHARRDRHGGRLGGDRGRPPALDRLQLMKVEDAATGNAGVWITFIAVVLHLRRAGRHHDPGAARHGPPVPPRRRVRRPRRALRRPPPTRAPETRSRSDERT